MQQRYPGRIRESASPSGNSAVFKNWAFRQYQAPTVTYEVGDKTGSEQPHELAKLGKASCREQVRQYVEVSGVDEYIKKHTRNEQPRIAMEHLNSKVQTT